MNKKLEHVFLIDGSGFIFRAYYGIKATMNRPDGTPVNAVYGFTRMLMKMVEDTDADHIAVIFDRARKTFRNDIYPDYKANRDAPPEDLIPQFELVREATRALNVACLDMEGFEADDLIRCIVAGLPVEAGGERQADQIAIEMHHRVKIIGRNRSVMYAAYHDNPSSV